MTVRRVCGLVAFAMLAACSSRAVPATHASPSGADILPSLFPGLVPPDGESAVGGPTSLPPTSSPTTVPSVSAAAGGQPILTDADRPPVLYRVPTSQRVVFLTIDDGWTRDPAFLTMVKQADVPISTFLIGQALSQDPAYWQTLTRLGATVEDHTISHPDLTTLTADQQRAQVCGDADIDSWTFGRRPTLMRPPYGAWNAATVGAAAQCGMAAVVLWDVSVVHGRLHFARGSQLRPGDVLLLHFTPWIRIDFAAALRAIAQSGFAVGRLESFIVQGKHSPAPVSTAPTPRPKPTPTPSPTPTLTPSPSPTSTTRPTPSRSPTPSPTPSPSR